MKRKFVRLVAIGMTALLLTACEGQAGGSGEESSGAGVSQKSNAGANEENKEDAVTIKLPSTFVGEGTTQADLDKAVSEKGFMSATLNGDGSVTYVMSKEAHAKMMETVKQTLDEAIAEMPLSEDYPQVTAVVANEDYTMFTVTTQNEVTTITESFCALALYSYGAMYNHYNATPADNVHVDFLNATTGEVIAAGDSKNAMR